MNNNNNKIKFIFLFYCFSFILFSGCKIQDTNNLNNNLLDNKIINLKNYSDEIINNKKIISINDYFGENISLAYRKVDTESIECILGNCPKLKKQNKFFTELDCFFCNKGSEVYDNKIIIHVNSMNWVDTIARCTDKNTFEYPKNFTFVFKNKSKIIVTGEGYGYHKHSGEGCNDGEYEYKFKTNETWIFTKDPIKVNINVSLINVNLTNKLNIINAPATNYDEKPFVQKYSRNGLIVKCNSPDGFKVKPWFKVVKLDGLNLTKTQNVLMFKKGSNEYYKNPELFRFGSMYDGEYLIKGICKIIGKNGGVIYTKEGDKIFKVIVSGSSKGHLSKEWILKNN